MENFVLSEEQLEAANRDGFLLVGGIKGPDDCAHYIDRLTEYAEGKREAAEDMEVQREPRVTRGEVTTLGADLRKITRIAHHDDVFHDLVMTSSVVGAMQQLMSPNLKLFRADILLKPPLVGSAKGMHQDSPYWPIEPMALWSCWMPFEQATLENGCMMALRGSHKRGAQPHVKVIDDFVIPEERYDPDEMVAVPMDPGDGLFFHSLLMHATSANTSDKARRAITMSYMATESRYTADQPKPEFMPISGVDVAGGV